MLWIYSIENYISTSISLTIEKPYSIFQYKNNPYQNSSIILLKLRKGNDGNYKIYIYKNFSDIQQKTKGVFINYYLDNDLVRTNTCEFANIETGIYYIVISYPNYYYKDIEISNLYEYYELKEDQIIFTNWIWKFKKFI